MKYLVIASSIGLFYQIDTKDVKIISIDDGLGEAALEPDNAQSKRLADLFGSDFVEKIHENKTHKQDFERQKQMFPNPEPLNMEQES